jgi:hypothetical protein
MAKAPKTVTQSIEVTLWKAADKLIVKPIEFSFE